MTEELGPITFDDGITREPATLERIRECVKEFGVDDNVLRVSNTYISFYIANDNKRREICEYVIRHLYFKRSYFYCDSSYVPSIIMQFGDIKLLMFDDFTMQFGDCDTHRNMIRFLPEYDKYIRRIQHAFCRDEFVDALIRREREYDELKEQVATLTSSEQQLKEQVDKLNTTLDTILQTLLKH